MKKLCVVFLLFYASCFGVDGQLDPSFGTGGIVVTPVGSTGIDGAAIVAVAIQADGKIIAGGYANPTGNIQFAIARYNTNGTLDITFNPSGPQPGIVFTTINGDEQINSIVLQVDGKIVVAGFTIIAGVAKVALARYNTDGSLDTSFNSTGIVVTDFGGNDFAVALALQPDGKIVIAGTTSSAQIIARYYPDGTLDDGSQGGTGFGVGGRVVSTIFGSSGDVSSIAITNTAQILMGGTIGSSPNRNFAIARFNAEGSLDVDFGTGGLAQTTLSIDAHSTDMRLQPDHKIVIVGGGTTGISDFITARFYPDGIIDDGSQGGVGFGTGASGTVVTNLGNDDLINGVVIQQDGKIVVAGFSITPTTGQFAAARYTSIGAFDTTFNPPFGFVLTTFPDFAQGFALAHQIDGKIVVVGIDGTLSAGSLININFALARYQGERKLIAPAFLFPMNATPLNTTVFTMAGVAENPSNIGVFVNGTLVGLTAATSMTNTWSFNPPTPMANGTYIIQAIAQYTSGNVNLASDPITFVVNDLATPAVTSPARCSIHASPVIISGIADANTALVIRINELIFETTSSDTGAWSLAVNLPIGNYTATVQSIVSGDIVSTIAFAEFFVRESFSPLPQAILAKHCCGPSL